MPDIMDITETAEYLKCCEQTLRNKARRKEIPHRYVGGKYLFSRTALQMWASGYEPKDFFEVVAQKMLEQTV